MRALGLDYGGARCGCALSDASGTIATPIETVANPAGRRGLDALAGLVAARGVERVVVGLPISLSGADSAQTLQTRRFAERLAKRLGERVPVELHDERLTTRLAQRSAREGGGTSAAEDSRAAAHMLESWLAARRREPAGRANA